MALPSPGVGGATACGTAPIVVPAADGPPAGKLVAVTPPTEAVSDRCTIRLRVNRLRHGRLDQGAGTVPAGLLCRAEPFTIPRHDPTSASGAIREGTGCNHESSLLPPHHVGERSADRHARGLGARV